MKNIVGQIASKEDFYYRKREIKRILQNLDAGANLQIAAPRRVGKSSILYHLKDNPPQGYICLYIEVESARSINEFYRKIYREIFKSEAVSTGKRIGEQFKANKGGFWSRLKGISVAGVGIDFNDAPEVNYEEELTNLLSGLDLGGDRLVLMIDEFPEVILNIAEDNNGDTVEARKFLQSNRELRNQPEIRGKVQFVYTGSNSLNVTVANLDASVLINDLASVPVDPLRNEEAADLITQVLSTYQYSIQQDQILHALSRIEWNIPFYFQLLIQEIINQIEPEESITNQLIDESFLKIMEQRNDHYFEHYVRRLKRVFNETQLKFVQRFLNQLAQAESISKAQMHDMAHGLLSESETKRVLDILKYDGYVISVDENNYKFNSPILKQWWYNHEC